MRSCVYLQIIGPVKELSLFWLARLTFFCSSPPFTHGGRPTSENQGLPGHQVAWCPWTLPEAGSFVLCAGQGRKYKTTVWAGLWKPPQLGAWNSGRLARSLGCVRTDPEATLERPRHQKGKCRERGQRVPHNQILSAPLFGSFKLKPRAMPDRCQGSRGSGLTFHTQSLQKLTPQGWRVGSVIRSACPPCTGPRFDSQHRHGGCTPPRAPGKLCGETLAKNSNQS